MNQKSLLLVLGTLLLPPGVAGAVDVDAGRKLVEAHCYGCHGEDVYLRDDRRITSIEGLHKQVQRCELALGLRWFDDDIENVAAYLNREFYRFDR